MAVRGQGDLLTVVRNRKNRAGGGSKNLRPLFVSNCIVLLSSAGALGHVAKRSERLLLEGRGLLEVPHRHSLGNLYFEFVGGKIDVFLNTFDGECEQNALDGALDYDL
jgi:hypothetical protein